MNLPVEVTAISKIRRQAYSPVVPSIFCATNGTVKPEIAMKGTIGITRDTWESLGILGNH